MLKKLLVLVMLVSVAIVAFPRIKIDAATWTSASVTLSDSRISNASTSYAFLMSNVSATAIVCVTVKFNPTADGVGTTLPTGMVVSGAGVNTGASNLIAVHTGYSVSVSNNVVTYKHASTGQSPSASARTLTLTGITNGSTAGTAYFAIVNTYGNTDCATTPIDTVTIAYIFTNGQTVTGTVDPTLTFSIAGVASGQSVNGATTNITTTSTTVPFGVLSTSTNRIGAHDLSIGTNANGGYTVTTMYTGQFTNGTANITNHTGTNASPTSFSAAGTESFGYTTADTTLGTGTAGRFTSNTWAAFSTSPVEVAYNGTAVSQTIRTGYQVGIAATTPAGSYTTTVVYTATPVY